MAGQEGKAKEVGNSQAEVPGYGWGSERQDQTPLCLTGQEGETGQWLPLQKKYGARTGPEGCPLTIQHPLPLAGAPEGRTTSLDVCLPSKAFQTGQEHHLGKLR